MAIKGIRQAKISTSQLIEQIGGSTTERVINDALSVGIKHAVEITPIDTGTLVNSQFRQIERKPASISGKAGFNADYAQYVHEKSGKLKGQKRKRKGSAGNYWDPNAEPDFLRKGFERDGLAEIKETVQKGYKL